MYARLDDLDVYDERKIFSVLSPLLGAYPVPEALAAVLPPNHPWRDPSRVRDELRLPAAHAVRRARQAEPWTRENAVITRIPEEVVDAHRIEVTSIVARPPPPVTMTRVQEPRAPASEYYDASLGVIRGRIEVDPVVWAKEVAEMDEQATILLAKETHDWAPWRPMLHFVVMLRALDENDVVLRAAEHRLLLLARRLLDAQGFTIVKVADTLGHAPELQRQTQRILGNMPRVKAPGLPRNYPGGASQKGGTDG